MPGGNNEAQVATSLERINDRLNDGDKAFREQATGVADLRRVLLGDMECPESGLVIRIIQIERELMERKAEDAADRATRRKFRAQVLIGLIILVAGGAGSLIVWAIRASGK